MKMKKIRTKALLSNGYNQVSCEFTEDARICRTLAKYSQDVLWVFSLERMRFTFLSQAIEQFTGYTVQEALGRRPEALLTPESYERVAKLLREELSLETSAPSFSDRTTKFEYEALHKDGHTVWFEATAAFESNEHDKPVAIVGISREITERKKAEDKLKNNREFGNIILNTLDVHIAILDAQGVIMTINDAWRRFAEENQGRLSALSEGTNYLEACAKACDEGDNTH